MTKTMKRLVPGIALLMAAGIPTVMCVRYSQALDVANKALDVANNQVKDLEWQLDDVREAFAEVKDSFEYVQSEAGAFGDGTTDWREVVQGVDFALSDLQTQLEGVDEALEEPGPFDVRLPKPPRPPRF